MTQSLSDAVAAFLGPIMAEYARLIEDGDPSLPVIIRFGGYEHETTLGAIKALDRAYAEQFGRNQKSARRRRERKAAGRFL